MRTRKHRKTQVDESLGDPIVNAMIDDARKDAAKAQWAYALKEKIIKASLTDTPASATHAISLHTMLVLAVIHMDLLMGLANAVAACITESVGADDTPLVEKEEFLESIVMSFVEAWMQVSDPVIPPR
jgi:hypothetical protein